jgi:hypothetical protein
LRKIMVVLAIILGASALSTSAFARGGVVVGHHLASRGDSHHSVSKLLHRGPLHCNGYGRQWDPWGHWGTYYGPMIAIP